MIVFENMEFTQQKEKNKLEKKEKRLRKQKEKGIKKGKWKKNTEKSKLVRPALAPCINACYFSLVRNIEFFQLRVQ